MNIDHMAYYPISIEESGPPLDGDIVIVSGGIAQYRGGEWFSGMEIPPFQRPIAWEVTHYMPIPIFGPNEITEDPYEVVINHTDPVQKETALCLKYRQRAREAEAALKVSDAKNTVMYDALEELSCLGNGEYYGNSEGNRIAQKAISDMVAIADKQLEDVLMPDKGLPECQWRRPCGTCYNLGSINSGGACSPHCSAPNKVEDVLIPDKK